MSATLCRDPARFAALGPRWADLYRRCRAATPFQTHPWLHSWWLSYGLPGRLRLVLVHRAGQLVGAAPLMLAFRPFPVLVPLGTGISDHCDVLLDDSCADAAAAALAAGLRRAARTAVVDLREVRPGGCAERLYRHWSGPRRELADSVCLELPGLPPDGLLARLPRTSARRLRRKVRRLDRAGVEHRAVPAGEVPAAVAGLLRLHVLQWRGRGITPEHLRARFAGHLVRALTAMVRDGTARVTEYRLDGRVVAADAVLLSGDFLGGYLHGAHPGLRARVDVSAMLLRHDAEYAAATGRGVIGLLRGTEPYKLHWRPEAVTNRRLLLARPVMAPALRLRAAGRAARVRLAGAVRGRGPVPGVWWVRLNRWRALLAGAR
ncbi:glycosyl transferase family 1 [Streptomyces carminius]|uniref:Glycosyl transferase family 1 n=1 Tax=Streptomyces carminius TaxID=2665496 RepID=A0A2M8M6F2_9ACTN|nr:GNAT family N-acetyltransferase [Streptomyces carminius]PJE99787.1 glycosyl transferase family 1 [Streptomyces carminius]